MDLYGVMYVDLDRKVSISEDSVGGFGMLIELFDNFKVDFCILAEELEI